MLPPPRADLKPNTADFERLPLVKPTGFREYDARWLFPQEINLMGLNAIGLGHGDAVRPSAGCRSASSSATTTAPIRRQREAGADHRACWPAAREVHDIGLALSPMAYFAQFELEVEGVAMVTASHNDNGWTGIKMGFAAPADLRARRDDAR